MTEKDSKYRTEKEMIKLTEQDWLKLRDYNKIIAQRI